MTIEETRTYLKSYRNMLNRVEYIENKLINVKAIKYEDSKGGICGVPKTTNDYIMMKDKYLNEMAVIRSNIESLEDMQYRDVLFYKYVECLDMYEVARLMDCSESSAYCRLRDAIKELSKSL